MALHEAAAHTVRGPACALPMPFADYELLEAVAADTDLDEPLVDFLNRVAFDQLNSYGRNRRQPLKLVGDVADDPCNSCTVLRSAPDGGKPCVVTPPVDLGPLLWRAVKARAVAMNEGLIMNAVKSVTKPTEDAVADVRAHIFNKLDAYQPHRSSPRWFMKIVATNHAKRSGRRHTQDASELTDSGLDDVIELGQIERDRTFDLRDGGVGRVDSDAGADWAYEVIGQKVEAEWGMDSRRFVDLALQGREALAEAAGLHTSSLLRKKNRVAGSEAGRRVYQDLTDRVWHKSNQEER